MLEHPLAMIPEPNHPSDQVPHHPSTAKDSGAGADGALHCNTALRKAASAHRSLLSHSLCARVPLAPKALSQSGRCALSLSAISRHWYLEPPLNRSPDRSTTAATAIKFAAHTHTHTQRPLQAIAPTTNSVPMIPVSRDFPFSFPFSFSFSAAPSFTPLQSDRVHSRGRIASQNSLTLQGRESVISLRSGIEARGDGG